MAINIRNTQAFSKRKNEKSAENKIAVLAKNGVFAKAGQEAIASSHARGLAVTIAEDGHIFRLRPDGSKKKIGTVPVVPKNKYISAKYRIKI